ncbi:CFL1 Probable ferric reductase transmembrane component [Candida maltosa Xu316]
MSLLSFISTISLLLPLILGQAKEFPKNSIPLAKAIFACKLNVHEDVGYCKTNTPDDYGCLCTNKDAIASFVGCFAYTQENPSQAVEFFVDFCSEYGNTTVDMDDIYTAYHNYTEYGYYNVSNTTTATNISTTTESNIDHSDIGNYTFSLESSIDQFLINWDHTFYYGAGILGYWGMVLLIGAVFNWSKYMFPGLMTDLNGPFFNWLRKHVLLPATMGKKKCQNYSYLRVVQFYMPSRFETIVLLGFVVVCSVTLSINTYFAQGDEVIFPSYYARLRYVANRTGTCSTMMIPLVILFAGRNNILQYLTRWNYSTFITFHRYVARMMFAFVVIHAVCFTIALGPSYVPVMKLPFMIWGTAATVLAGMMVFLGMLYFRRRWYEVFLVGHIIMAVFYVVGTWRHVVDLGYMWYVYASIGIWGLDRVIRMVRLLAFGFPEAAVALMSDETLKVVIPKPDDWIPTVGGHVFVHFMQPAFFWQSHPFTVGHSTNKHITLYCKVKNGITRALYNQLVNIPNKSAKIKVGVEGPYGEPSGVKKSQTAVFIAGGNGIPGMYSEVTHLARQFSNKSSKRLKLYWVVREYRSVYWFYDELEQLRNTNIETTVFVTQPNNPTHIDELASKISTFKFETKSCYSMCGDSKTLGSADVKSELRHIRFCEGRPSMEKIVSQEVEEATGSIAFVACCHPAMVDDVRHEVCKNVDNPEKVRVDFYEQLLGWA